MPPRHLHADAQSYQAWTYHIERAGLEVLCCILNRSNDVLKTGAIQSLTGIQLNRGHLDAMAAEQILISEGVRLDANPQQPLWRWTESIDRWQDVLKQHLPVLIGIQIEDAVGPIACMTCNSDYK